MPLIRTEDDPPLRMGGSKLDILKLAHEAGLREGLTWDAGQAGPGCLYEGELRHLQRFADLVLEEGAKVCDLPRANPDSHSEDGCYDCGVEIGREQAVAMIRAMKGAGNG